MKDKATAIVLAILFGWFGAHKFYLNEGGAGVLYLIFSVLTCGVFPAFLGWIDALFLALMSSEEFDRRYNQPLVMVGNVPTRVTVRRTVVGPDGVVREVIEEGFVGGAPMSEGRVSWEELHAANRAAQAGQRQRFSDDIPVGRVPRSAQRTGTRSADQQPYALRAPRDQAELERFVLLAAQDNNGSLAAAELSLMTKLSLTEAKDALESMLRNGVATMDLDDDGHVRYLFAELTPAEPQARPQPQTQAEASPRPQRQPRPPREERAQPRMSDDRPTKELVDESLDGD